MIYKTTRLNKQHTKHTKVKHNTETQHNIYIKNNTKNTLLQTQY